MDHVSPPRPHQIDPPKYGIERTDRHKDGHTDGHKHGHHFLSEWKVIIIVVKKRKYG